jgi:hypothetical protein
MKEKGRRWDKLVIAQRCGSAEKKPWREEVMVHDCARRRPCWREGGGGKWLKWEIYRNPDMYL